MWGLDVVSAQAAIEAMNGVNGVVQNMAFALSFFGAPILLTAAVVVAYMGGDRGAMFWFAAALVICLAGVHFVTFTYHIPLNQYLMTVALPLGNAEAARIWTEYSASWKAWNWVRTASSGLAVLCVGLALI